MEAEKCIKLWKIVKKKKGCLTPVVHLTAMNISEVMFNFNLLNDSFVGKIRFEKFKLKLILPYRSTSMAFAENPRCIL